MKLWLLFLLLLTVSCSSIFERREIVKVSYKVNHEGVPVDIKVLRSSNEKLNQMAIDSIKSWRFEKGSHRSSNHVVKLQFDPVL